MMLSSLRSYKFLSSHEASVVVQPGGPPTGSERMGATSLKGVLEFDSNPDEGVLRMCSNPTQGVLL